MSCSRVHPASGGLTAALFVGVLLTALIPCAANAAAPDTEPEGVATGVGTPAVTETGAGTPTSARSNPALHWIRSSVGQLATPRTLGILAVGGVLAAASTGIENPKRDARFFERPMFDGGADFGNRYGDAATLGIGTAGLLAAGWVTGSGTLGETGREMARSLLYATAVTTPIKLAVGRTRPNGGHYSFPSGHSAAAFAVAPVIARRLGGRWGTLAYLAAATTAAGRIEENKHYLSDVVFGAAVGLAVGLTVTDGTPARTTPSFVVSDHGVGLGIRF